VIRPGDDSALREAMTRLFVDSSLRIRMGQAGLRRFYEQFTESHFQMRFLTALGLEPHGRNGAWAERTENTFEIAGENRA